MINVTMTSDRAMNTARCGQPRYTDWLQVTPKYRYFCEHFSLSYEYFCFVGILSFYLSRKNLRVKQETRSGRVMRPIRTKLVRTIEDERHCECDENVLVLRTF